MATFPVFPSVDELFATTGFSLPAGTPVRKLPPTVMPAEAFAFVDHSNSSDTAGGGGGGQRKKRAPGDALPLVAKNALDDAHAVEIVAARDRDYTREKEDEDAMDIDEAPPSPPKKKQTYSFDSDPDDAGDDPDDALDKIVRKYYVDDDSDDGDFSDGDDEEEEEEEQYEKEDGDENDDDDDDEDDESSSSDSSAMDIDEPDAVLALVELEALRARHTDNVAPVHVASLPETFAHPSTIAGVLGRLVSTLKLAAIPNEGAVQRAVHAIATSQALAAAGDAVSGRHLRIIRDDFAVPSSTPHDVRDRVQKLVTANTDLFALSQTAALNAKMLAALSFES